MEYEHVKEILVKQLELLYEESVRCDNYIGKRELTSSMIELSKQIIGFRQ